MFVPNSEEHQTLLLCSIHHTKQSCLSFMCQLPVAKVYLSKKIAIPHQLALQAWNPAERTCHHGASEALCFAVSLLLRELLRWCLGTQRRDGLLAEASWPVLRCADAQEACRMPVSADRLMA